MDLPGIPKENVKIDIQDGALVVQGERSEEKNEGGDKGFRRSERRFGSFYRRIALPQGVDPNQAKANMKDGVLEITLPLPQQKQGRRLQIS